MTLQVSTVSTATAILAEFMYMKQFSTSSSVQTQLSATNRLFKMISCHGSHLLTWITGKPDTQIEFAVGLFRVFSSTTGRDFLRLENHLTTTFSDSQLIVKKNVVVEVKNAHYSIIFCSSLYCSIYITEVLNTQRDSKISFFDGCISYGFVIHWNPLAMDFDGSIFHLCFMENIQNLRLSFFQFYCYQSNYSCIKTVAWFEYRNLFSRKVCVSSTRTHHYFLKRILIL